MSFSDFFGLVVFSLPYARCVVAHKCNNLSKQQLWLFLPRTKTNIAPAKAESRYVHVRMLPLLRLVC